MSALESYLGSDGRLSVVGSTDVLPWLTMFETSLPTAEQRGVIEYLLRLMAVLSSITLECVLLFSTNCSFLTDMMQNETLVCAVLCSLVSSCCARS